MMCPILNAGWLQIGISAFTMHDQALPPVPPLPVPLPNIPGLIEGPAPMGWPPGFLAHKKVPTVLVDGNPGIKQGHDIGYVIPHFAIPMNALCAVNTLFSKHKVMFPVSKVLIGGSPAGTYLAFALGLICCNPVSLPTGVVILIKCTVWTSMSLVDFFKGLAYMAIDMVFDALWNKVFKGSFSGVRGLAAPLINIPRMANPNALIVLGGLTFREMVMWGGHGLVGRYMLSQIVNKGVDHLLKTWIVAPLIRDLPRGGSGIGRGDILSRKFFGPYW